MEQFITLGDLKLDEWNGEDIDNSVLKDGVLPPNAGELEWLNNLEYTIAVNDHMKRSELIATATYVPFRRNLKLGSVGSDVFAVRRALAKAGFGPWGKWSKVPRTMGPYLVRYLKSFQKSRNLKVDGVYGIATHQKLMKYFDAYGAYLMKSWKPPVRKSTKRETVVSAAMFGYHNRGSIHYTQSSWRMYGVRNHIKPPNIPRYEDCSSFATWCYWVAGASDPNGLGYNGQGYTGTQVNHGKYVTLGNASAGDLIFYGWSRGIPTHVAVYVGNGRVVSHGSEVGPLFLPATYRSITTIRSYL